MQPIGFYPSAIHCGHQMPSPIVKKAIRKISWDWQKKCAGLNKEQFLYELSQLFAIENNGTLCDAHHWIDHKLPDSSFFNQAEDVFMPYVMKLEVKPGSEIAFHGDIHGDKDSLIAYLKWLAEHEYTDMQDPLRIIKKNFYMIFLGDYTDRGKYGAEVIFTLARLKRTNPNAVFLVRGNHEDADLNAAYGFKQELEHKFKDDGIVLKTVKRMYNYLPVALYLTCKNKNNTNDALLCCHGGVEVGFNVENCKKLLASPEPLNYTLLGAVNRSSNTQTMPYHLEYIKKLKNNVDFIPQSPCNPQLLHFLWNDFDVDNVVTMADRFRGWECDKAFTDFVNAQQSSDACKVRGIMRGHQHGDHKMMNRILNHDHKNSDADIGVGKLWITTDAQKAPQALWDGIVCTFSVCPDGGYGKEYQYNFDSFGVLKTADDYNNWKLQMHRIKPE